VSLFERLRVRPSGELAEDGNPVPHRRRHAVPKPTRRFSVDLWPAAQTRHPGVAACGARSRGPGDAWRRYRVVGAQV